MDFNEINLFGKKTFGDILKEIYNNQKDKEKEIRDLIIDMKPMIETKGDAVILAPLLTKYLELSIKNDDTLIKMAGIIQRAVNAGKVNDDGSVQLSDNEKDQLLQNVKNMKAV